MKFDLAAFLAMAHSPVRNYAIPGLTSSLIGTPSASGTVRLFHCSRAHQECITPHSHRFDFQCLVLEGQVINRVWQREDVGSDGDAYQESLLAYKGACGKYEKTAGAVCRWVFDDTRHVKGDWYGMTHDQVHSIIFDRGTTVLFFEGPTKSDTSLILEPWIDGECVPTFKVEPWMFKKTPIAKDAW